MSQEKHEFEPDGTIGQSKGRCAHCEQKPKHPNHDVGGELDEPTVTITEFLLARIDEDIKTAQTGFLGPQRWSMVAVPGSNVGVPNGWSCSTVIVESEAKRQIIADHRLEVRHVVPYDVWAKEYDTTVCATCVSWSDGPRSPDECTPACVTLRALAIPYTEHPDYRDEWKL